MLHELLTVTLVLAVLAPVSGQWQSSRLYKPRTPYTPQDAPMTGLDLLKGDNFAILKGKTVAVVTNHTGLSSEGESILDLLQQAEGVQLKAIFAPEHGFYGNVSDGVKIGDSQETRTGVKIYSLYGSTRKPTPDQLDGIDVVLFDMQDVGARYYTYTSTMTLVMDACARDKVHFWVLDRPNPVRGDVIDGPLLRKDYFSFVGMHPVPIRHAMTMGELAIMINERRWLTGRRRARLTVIPALGWRRNMWWDETGLEWIPPSPNIPAPETALVYLGACLLEGTNVSEGRGTFTPFHIAGAPWIGGEALAGQLNRQGLPGVTFVPITFTPKSIEGMAAKPKYQDQECGGVRLEITGREAFQPLHTAAVMIHVIQRSYPQHFQWREQTLDRLWGSDVFRRYLDNRRNIKGHPSTYAKDIAAFYKMRGKYLIYEE